MRAARLLQILLMLQDRGRMTAEALARALEVDRRTILRDVDALGEAGLPVIAFAGQGGGIELGFDHRTRLTGLARDEAEAMAILLATVPPLLADLGLAEAAARAQAKLRAALPGPTRSQMARMAALVVLPPADRTAGEPSRPAMALALREGRAVTLRAGSNRALTLVPLTLDLHPDGWVLVARDGSRHPEADWGDLVILAVAPAPRQA